MSSPRIPSMRQSRPDNPFVPQSPRNGQAPFTRLSSGNAVPTQGTEQPRPTPDNIESAPGSQSLEAGAAGAGTQAPRKGIRGWWSRQSRCRKYYILVGFAALLLAIVAGIVVGVVVSRNNRQPADVGGAFSGDDTPGKSGLGSSSPPDGPASGYQPGTPAVIPANNGTTGGNSTSRGGKFGYDSLVVFGASYCDNGHLRLSKFASSLTKTPYFGGRHSNGPVWDEFLSDVIGPNGTQTALVNYAFSGAVIDNSVTPKAVPDLITQSNSFLSDMASGSVDKHTKTGKVLVAIWIGLNTYTQVWLDQIDGKTNAAQGQSTITSQVATLASVASKLANSTAFATPPDLLILPLPPGSQLLSMQSLAKRYGGNVNDVEALSQTFNDQLRVQITNLQNKVKPGQQIFTYDFVAWWRGVYDSPLAHGFTTSTQACYSNDVVCSDASRFFLFDSQHMTTTAHRQLAQLLAQNLALY